VIASQAIRLVSASPRRAPRPAHAQRIRPGARSSTRPQAAHRDARSRALLARAPAVVRAASWDLRIFGLAIAAIVFCFALALLYVSQTTALSVAGYDVQRLAAQRDEIRRQNSLLEVQSARLDSPARIAADAQRLGMVHARYVPVIPAQPLIAKR
jgi:cell division protein FtsL